MTIIFCKVIVCDYEPPTYAEIPFDAALPVASFHSLLEQTLRCETLSITIQQTGQALNPQLLEPLSQAYPLLTPYKVLEVRQPWIYRETVYVKALTGKNVKLEAPHSTAVSTMSVNRLKKLLQTKEGIPPEQQRVVCRGRQLEDWRTLGDYGIETESTIHLVLRLRGGFDHDGSPIALLVEEYGIGPFDPIVIEFPSEYSGHAIEEISVDEDNLLTVKCTGKEVPGTVMYEAQTRTAAFTPLETLVPGSRLDVSLNRAAVSNRHGNLRFYESFVVNVRPQDPTSFKVRLFKDGGDVVPEEREVVIMRNTQDFFSELLRNVRGVFDLPADASITRVTTEEKVPVTDMRDVAELGPKDSLQVFM